MPWRPNKTIVYVDIAGHPKKIEEKYEANIIVIYKKIAFLNCFVKLQHIKSKKNNQLTK